MCQNLVCAILRLKTRWHTIAECATLSFCDKLTTLRIKHSLSAKGDVPDFYLSIA